MKLGPLNLFSRKATVKKNGIDFQRLEDRLLFSGSPLADVSAGKAGASDHLPDPAAVVAAESHPATVDPVTADHAIQPGPVTPEAPMGVAAVKAAHRLEVLVVDSAVKDAQAFAQSLISSASSNVDIKLVMLDANNGPALEQITQALAQISGGTHSVDAIHLVTHAEAGEISIGSTIITSDQLAAGTVTSAAMESWHNYLAQGADVLLYGCDVAKGSSGIQFINHLAQVTGADVAASNDLTGAASLGGNWTLEASTGHIETGILSSTMGVLLPTGATPTVTISAPSTVFIGQNVNFDVNFTNSGTVDTGYGPYIDVLLPRNGMDGHAGTDTPDGIGTGTVTATILGSTMTATSDYVFTDNDGGDPTTGTFTHPFAKDATGAPIVLTGTVGDRILVYQLPFGSLVPNQPAIDLHLSVQSSNLADLGAPLPIHVNGGFMYGSDPLDNPVADNPIFQKPYSDTSAWTSASVTPKLLTLTKTYNGPEGETATGPNFQRSYTVNLDIASGQTITNLDVTDLLPSNAQFVSVTGITDGGVVNNVLTGGLTATTSTPGGEVGVTFASISDGHAQFDINFYVSRTDQSSGVVIDASSGSPVSVDNNVAALGDWTPIDVRDAGGVDNVSAGGLGAPAENTFTAKSIAIQKGWSIVNDVGTAGLSPGDTVEFTLNFQISDYFGFQNVVVTDTLSDGWRLDSHFDPTLTVNGNSWILPSAAFTGILWGSDIYGNSILTAANVAHTVNTDNNGATPATDGKSTLAFDVSQELVSRGENDQLLGGGLHAIGPTPTTDLPNSLTGGGVTNDGPTTGIIKFHAVVQEKYSDTYPSGHPQVTQGDTMSNDVNVTGDVLDNNNFIGGTGKYGVTGHNESDTSSVTGTVSGSSLQKSIYAVNGNAVGPFNQISPGDDITYRLRYIIPTGNIDTMTLKDYLPLPVFNVDDPNSDGVASGLGEWTFDPTVSAAAPSAGTYKFGPTEDYSTYVNAHPNGTPGAGNPTFSIDTQSNVLQWSYGTYDSPSDNQQVIDLLFTVKVNAKPFADKLVLTNQASSNEGSTQLVFSSNNQIIPIVLSEPNVIIDKGVVASDQGPSVGTVGGLTFADVGSDGFTGTLSGLANATAIGALNLTSGILPDAGDKVRFALVAMNTGGSDAFDVTVTDTIKNSYVSTYADAAAFASGTNFKVYRGSDGTHPLTAGTDYSLTWNAGTKSFQVVLADNFDTGDVTDNKHGGLNRARDASGTDLTDGKNSIVVLYDLTLKSDVLASSMVTNTASLTEYRGAPGGGNYLAAPLTDTADVKTVAPALVKDLFSSEVISADNALNQAVIGEIVTYTIDVTLPEGQMNNLKLDDALGSGLGFVNVESVTFSNPGAISTANTINAGNSIDGSNHVSLSGSTLTFDLGNVTNTDSDNSTAEHITIKFKAVVLDVISNQQNTALTNHASSTYDSTDNTGAVTHLTTSSISAPNVTVIEPTLALSTLVANNTDVQAFAASVRADAGDLLQYKIVITNANGANDRDAFDLALSDAIPAQLSGLSIVSVNSTGTIQVGGATVAPAAGDFTLAGNTLSNTSNIDMLKNSSITIVVQGTFAGATGSTVANTADVKWTSLDGDYSANRAVGVTSGVERTGADGILNGGSLNDYQVQSTANVTSAILVFKSVVDTSQSATSGSNVAIGEVVRYRLVTTLGEGAAANFQIEDNLPTGMRFLNDGSANYVFISTGAAAITSTGITNIAGLAGTTIQGSTATVLALTSAQITGTFNDNNISTTIAGTGTGDATLYNSGQPVFFRLGNLSNSDSDVDNEYVVIEFNAVVENIQANQSGTTLSNNYTVLVDTNGDGKPGYVNLIRDMDGSGTINAGDVTSIATDTNNDATTGTIIPATSAPATLNVVEPNLGITKSVTATTGAAVTYKVVITNPAAANASTAFDSNFSDILNGANLTLSGHSISSTAGVTGITDTSAANTVSYTIGMIPVGESVTVTYSANVLTTPSGATTIDNTASATTTSLDGTTISSPFHGTVAGTLGAAGSSTGERSGSDGEGAGLNNYAVSATEKLGSVGDKVWFDVNGNGVQDAGEPGIASAPVSLRWAGPDGIFGNGDDSLISTTTDASGGYSFNALPIDSPGQFRVTVDTSGAPFTTYGLTAETYDKDGIGTANQSTFSLVSATPNPRDQDFGYRGAGSIGDLVWHDQNSNGIKDAAEQGIPNVTVTLTWYGFDGVSGGGDDITYTTTTDSSGL